MNRQTILISNQKKFLMSDAVFISPKFSFHHLYFLIFLSLYQNSDHAVLINGFACMTEGSIRVYRYCDIVVVWGISRVLPLQHPHTHYIATQCRKVLLHFPIYTNTPSKDGAEYIQHTHLVTCQSLSSGPRPFIRLSAN